MKYIGLYKVILPTKNSMQRKIIAWDKSNIFFFLSEANLKKNKLSYL